MSKTILKKSATAISFIAVIALGIFAGAGAAHAQGALGQDWSQFLQGWLPNFQGAGGIRGEELAINFIRNAIRIVKYAIGGLAALYGVIYGMMLVFGGGKEETIKKQQKNFIGIMIAFVLLMVGDAIAGIFNPEGSTSSKLIDFSAANDQLRDIVNYIKWLLGSVLVLLMTISGIRMMTAQGEEEKLTKEKKNLTWSGIGILVMLLASNIVKAFYVVNQATGVIFPAVTVSPIQEAAGVIRLILVLLAPLAVIFTIFAGFFYLTAMDNEDRATKGKRMIIGGVTGIIVIYIAYAIVNTVIQAPLAPPV